MLNKIGVKAIITSDKNEIEKSDRLILPGVGAFDFGMEELNKSGLAEVIRYLVLSERKPILGICLGAQLMGNFSEEGKLPGLGLVDMKVIRFRSEKMKSGLKIPHMGWDEVIFNKKSKLIDNFAENPRFYFVHSFHFVMANEADILCTSEHSYPFTAAFECDNIAGVQFHPEKSHKFGIQLLKNFTNES